MLGDLTRSPNMPGWVVPRRPTIARNLGFDRVNPKRSAAAPACPKWGAQPRHAGLGAAAQSHGCPSSSGRMHARTPIVPWPSRASAVQHCMSLCVVSVVVEILSCPLLGPPCFAALRASLRCGVVALSVGVWGFFWFEAVCLPPPGARRARWGLPPSPPPLTRLSKEQSWTG